MDVSHRKLACALAFLVIAGVGSYLTHLTGAMAQHEQQLLMAELVSSQASVIERRLSQSLSSTDILAHEVIQRGGEFDQFEAYADEILRSIGGISNLQLAPDGVITRIHPLAGNAKALGHNILVDDSQRLEAQQAVDQHRLTLAGPFELVQGGVAVIGRNPVFFTKDGKEQFWGFVSALIFLDDLLQATELDQLEDKGYSFQLSRTHPDTARSEVFASSATKLSGAFHSAEINVPNATWSLSMSRAAIEEPLSIHNQEFIVSTSVGITMIPADGRQAVDILKNADMAMYAAKKAGKRHYSFFDQSLQTEALEKIAIENDLNEGINDEQFLLHLQPLIDFGDGEVVGYEALIRWQHPDEGLLFPDRFIGVAEDTGKIIEIGYWVIRKASAIIKKWAVQQRKCQHIAVNLSPRQFADPNLLDNVRTIVREAGIDAGCLEVEITESTVMANTEEAIRTLQRLRQMGITVAIDDFGTGYSSLAMLRRLPVDKLKIDRAFVLLLESTPSDQKVVEGLIAMAHALNIQVVAEGVETAGQLDLLRRFGCDYGQGYLFSKPVPLERLDQPVGAREALIYSRGSRYRWGRGAIISKPL